MRIRDNDVSIDRYEEGASFQTEIKQKQQQMKEVILEYLIESHLLMINVIMKSSREACISPKGFKRDTVGEGGLLLTERLYLRMDNIASIDKSSLALNVI